MISCSVNQQRGSISVTGKDIPAGTVTVTRNLPGEKALVLRNGTFALATGAFVREDPEVPFGVPVRYDLDLSITNRVLQRNLALTPDFTHGQQGWLPGAGRTFAIAADPISGRTVGSFGSISAPPSAVTPSLINRQNGASNTLAGTAYTLTYPTSAPTKPVTGDVLLLIHQQLESTTGTYTPPTLPTGWTKVIDSLDSNTNQRFSVWRFSWLSTTTATSLVVTFPAGRQGFGSLLTIRGASQTIAPVVTAVTRQASVDTTTTLTTDTLTAPRPSLVLAVSTGTTITGNGTAPTAASVTGATFYSTYAIGQTLSATRKIIYRGTAAEVTDWNTWVASVVSVADPSAETRIQQALVVLRTGVYTPALQPLISAATAALLVQMYAQGVIPLATPGITDADAVLAAYRNGMDVTAYLAKTLVTNRDIVVATNTLPIAGIAQPVSFQYNNWLNAGVALQIGFQVDQTISAARLIATAKAALLPASSKPYLLTGRIKFKTPDVWLWQDVLEQGTWQHLKDTKATWAAVRSSAVSVPADYLKLFVSIINPATGAEYVAPVQVLNPTASQVNSWIDYSFFFTTAVDIPATAVVQFFHGASVREYAVTWMFDQLGITSGDDRGHRSMYWLSGDSAVPSSAEDYYFGTDDWESRTNDSTISWAGTVGNSISVFTGPSKIGLSTTCSVTPEIANPSVCEPVHLSDPVAPQRGMWFSLMKIDALSYAARQAILTVIDRPDVIAVSQTRQWPSGSLLLKTDTFQERSLAITVFETGRILYMRNPNPLYPETGWYIAIGDVTETRILADHRKPGRLWTIPFVRVARPTGLIESAVAQSWADILASGDTYDLLRQHNGNWLDVLTKDTA